METDEEIDSIDSGEEGEGQVEEEEWAQGGGDGSDDDSADG